MRFTLSGIFCAITLCAVAAGFLCSHGQTGIYRTGRELDVAVVGEGVFEVSDPDTALSSYTRRGRFNIDSGGQVVIADGDRRYVLQPAISVPSLCTKVEVEPNGTISAETPGGHDRSQFGQILLCQFAPIDRELIDQGRLFTQSEAQSQPDRSTPGNHGFGLLQQGWLEEPDDWLHRLLRGPTLAVLGGVIIAGGLGWIGYELWCLRRLLEERPANPA